MKILLEAFRVHWQGRELSLVRYFKSPYFLLSQEGLGKVICIRPKGCTPKNMEKINL